MTNGDSLKRFSSLDTLENAEFYFPNWVHDENLILFDKPLILVPAFIRPIPILLTRALFLASKFREETRNCPQMGNYLFITIRHQVLNHRKSSPVIEMELT